MTNNEPIWVGEDSQSTRDITPEMMEQLSSASPDRPVSPDRTISQNELDRIMENEYERGWTDGNDNHDRSDCDECYNSGYEEGGKRFKSKATDILIMNKPVRESGRNYNELVDNLWRFIEEVAYG